MMEVKNLKLSLSEFRVSRFNKAFFGSHFIGCVVLRFPPVNWNWSSVHLFSSIHKSSTRRISVKKMRFLVFLMDAPTILIRVILKEARL